jgi:hypothetical protein
MMIMRDEHICLTGYSVQNMTASLTQNLIFFTDEAWFLLIEYMSAQNSRCWSSINPRQTFELSLHDQKIDVWCAITAT